MDDIRPAITSTMKDYALPRTQPNHTKTLGKDEFISILIAQLQHQDPTAPLENVDMVSQMTQFATMESVNAMAVTNMQSQAYSLIGKGIVGGIRNLETGAITEVIGTVDGAGIDAGKPYVLVGQARVYVEDIFQVFDKSIIAGNSESIIAATGMVGKYIRANVGASSDPIYVEGKAERWMVDDGIVFLTVEGQEISLHQVIAVADDMEFLGSRPAAPMIPQRLPAEEEPAF